LREFIGNLKNSFSTGKVEVYNTVAEVSGGEKPDEVVIPTESHGPGRRGGLARFRTVS
jgi:hypothetical protein